MAVRFVLGTSGSGKTRWCVNAIADALREGGDGPLVFLVPEQATFQAERSILSCPGICGYHRLHVLSFNRLQFQLCKTGVQNELSSLGRQMLVRQALSACRGRLRSLQASAATPGMAASLADLIRRLHEDNCTPRQLEEASRGILAKEPGNPAGLKFADIAVVYDAYLKLLNRPECDFFNPDSLLTEARGKVRDAEFLRGARLWVDGFSGFTLQQRDLLFEILSVCKEADIALCLDPQAIDLKHPDPDNLDPTSLFAPTEQTCIDLLMILKRCKMPLAEPVLLTQRPRFAAAPGLEQIERHFFSAGAVSPVSAADTIEIRGLSDIRAEAAFIACRIQHLVRRQNLRYRDIAVIVPDIGLYAHYLAGAFGPYGIPYFLDRPQNLQTHPLVELLIAALRAVQSGFESGCVQMLLKTDWNGLSSLEADILDNYCRAFGVGPQDWFSDTPWDFGPSEETIFEPQRIGLLRRKFFAPFGELFKTLQGRLAAPHCVNALWRLLEQLDIRPKLVAESQQDPDDSQFAHRRVWKKIQDVLEELVGIFGGQTFTEAEITAILLDVLSSLTLKQIPAAVDQVLIGSIERSRHPEIKVAFLAGATYKLFPVPLTADALLTDQDAQLAAREALVLTTPLEQMLSARRYLSYIALTRASHKLMMTFPLTDDKNTPAALWPGLERLCVLCPDVKIQYGNPAEMSEPQNLSAAALGEWFCAALGPESVSDEKTKTLARDLLSCCKASPDAAQLQLCGDVEYALAWRNEAILDKAIISRLILWPMKTSASRLATFAACPYQYFARYTLGLKKRELLRLLPVDIGDFYHTILNRLFEDLYRRGQDWAAAGNEVLARHCDRIAKELVQEDRHLSAFVRGSAYNTYIIAEAISNLKDFLPALAAVGAAGLFRQKAAELEFGINNPPVVVEMEKNRLLYLNGRIDRVDCADIDGQWTAIVIDYKSGSTTRKMNWTKFYHGLDVQLAVYLLALRRQTIENRPIENTAGAFYMPLEQSLETSFKKPDDDSGPTVKARGIFNGQYAEPLESNCEKSRYYSFAWKEGEPYSDYGRKDALRPEDFAATLRFAEGKIRSLGRQMGSGDIRAFPYRLGTQSPCSTCDYRPVCKFDWQLNEYNVLSRPGKLDVLQQVAGGQGQ
jgi:ATP-dependent helicase/nuclease subunit B